MQAAVTSVCATAPAAPAGLVAARGSEPGVYAGILLTGSQVDAAATVVNVGLDAGATRRGIAVALAAAMHSSSLNAKAHNGSHEGLFQQHADRTSGLYTDADRSDPIAASRMFFAQLTARVPGYDADPRGDAELADAVQESGDLDRMGSWTDLAASLVDHFIPLPAADPVEAAPAAPVADLIGRRGEPVVGALRIGGVAFAAAAAPVGWNGKPPADPSARRHIPAERRARAAAAAAAAADAAAAVSTGATTSPAGPAVDPDAVATDPITTVEVAGVSATTADGAAGPITTGVSTAVSEASISVLSSAVSGSAATGGPTATDSSTGTSTTGVSTTTTSGAVAEPVTTAGTEASSTANPATPVVTATETTTSATPTTGSSTVEGTTSDGTTTHGTTRRPRRPPPRRPPPRRPPPR